MTDQLQSASAPAIQAEALTKSFPGIRAVDALTLDVRAGEIFGLVGPDGAGKTTTLRMVAGFEQPTAGSVHLGGVDVTTLPPAKRDDPIPIPANYAYCTTTPNRATLARVRTAAAACWIWHVRVPGGLQQARGVGAERMSLITASRLSSAFLSPSRI